MGKERALFVALLAIACLFVLVGYNSQTKIRVAPKEMLSVAHRGASAYAPENTRAAFRKGVDLQADYLECDVHLSKDDELIVMHDDKVDRTTDGKGYIRNMTLAELKTLDAGKQFGEEFVNEQILTLQELVDEFYNEVGLVIEIKNPNDYPGIEEKVVQVLNQYDDLSGIIIQSFDVQSLKKIHSLLPEVEIAILIRPTDSFITAQKVEEYTDFAAYINFNVSFTNKRTVDLVHEHGGKVLVWSKKDRRLIWKAQKYGVDGIISDFSEKPEEMYLAKE
ncbi:glycerophosphodiester phosphodiesterase family protein [Sporosarcina sp. Te-1]|uniref:glycerophosphodiester phosphodiesterase n=1 Tax=Sporosarcina sp. Te-1 TaxID=2818390 RepID=UPI001A9EF846|nr:glycerophosphodiester phosphodiesterase family protein [Sporosarcina sp. Te-1]QTD42919.1 glycerophosphodiester phosphodiesterase [Sporosarcina sp. Te-1]